MPREETLDGLGLGVVLALSQWRAESFVIVGICFSTRSLSGCHGHFLLGLCRGPETHFKLAHGRVEPANATTVRETLR